jgi:MFS-type transporter involved in bile tolerance (Atg22 family)
MASDHGIDSSPHPSSEFITVGNSQSIPITHIGSTHIPTFSQPLSLRNILIVPHIIKNLIFVRQFTTNNFCTIEFDPFGISVEARPSTAVILRCNSSGPLYTVCRSTPAEAHLHTASSLLWQHRLGHPGNNTMSRLH